MEKVDTRGGARPGAGRPKGIKKPYKPLCFSLPEEYADKMKSLASLEGLSVSKFLQKLLDNYQ